MVMEKDISCYNFMGLIVYLRRYYGDEGVRKVTNGLIDNDEYLVADKYNPSKILPIQEKHLTDPAYWVSYEFSLALLANVKKVVGGPNPLSQAGEGAAMESLSKSALFLSRVFGLKFLSRQVARLNARFNRTKEVELIELTKNSASFALHYYSRFRVAKDICNWNLGVYTGIAKITGASEVKCEEIKCTVSGDEYCLFRLTWKEASLKKRVVRWLMRTSLRDLIADYDAILKDREQLIAKLTQSEKRYRALFEHNPIETIIVDQEGKVTEYNRAKSKSGGRLPDIGDIMYKDYAGRHKINMFGELMGSISSGIPKEFPEQQYDGRFFHTRISPFPDGAIITSIDITRLKRTEEILRESEEKYRNILESIEEGYFEADIASNFTFFNDSLCRILGFPREELMGMNNRQYMDKGTAKKVYKAFNRVYSTGIPARGFEYEIIRKDGTRRYVGSSASLIKDQEGKPIGFRGIMRDVTERRLAEEERKRLEVQLQHAQKMEAIGTLAGGVAHDLNNILSGLVSYPELLLMELPEDSPLRNAIWTIQKSGEKAAAVVQDLLTLARRGVAVSEVANLNDVVSEYLNSPEHGRLKSYNPGVQVETRLEEDLMNILGSPPHLSKTVMNLISNAAEAMPQGGEVVVTTETRYIDRPIRGYDDVKGGDYVVLAVSDTGEGISPQDMGKIFEPFYTKKEMGRSGTGLGMTVVWGTVKDHNGYIDVQSAEGKGTTFTLYFPVTRKERGKDEALLSIGEYKGKGESILLIDDVEEQRQIASGMLRTMGYSVELVSSGEEAVEYMKNNSADLLVLDMIMDPGIDGLDTYRRIVELHPGQRAIIASGFSETYRVKEAQRLGAGPYVKKPFLLNRIGPAIRAELDK